MAQEPLFPAHGEAWLLSERRGRTAQEALEAWRRGDPGKLLEGFALYLRVVEGKSPTTVELHRGHAERFLRFLDGMGRPPLAWDRGDALRYAWELRHRGQSEGSLLRLYYGLRAFGRFLLWAGYQPPPLELETPQPFLRRRRPLTPQELHAVMDRVRTLPTEWSMPFLALMVLLGEGGLRLQEAMALTPSDLDLEQGRLRLPGGWVPLSRKGRQALADYMVWRRERAMPGYPYLLITPRGKPFQRVYLSAPIAVLRDHTGVRLDTISLRITGQARLVSLYGSRRAKQLLKRSVVV
ncbi:MAG: site-specific integrase [Thermus sp.]